MNSNLSEPGRYLNLGCGKRFSRDSAWVNVDMAPEGQDVLRMNLLGGIGFPDGRFAAVYHSHVLEHFDPAGAARLIRECHRILQPGGILRVAVPDLERLARGYLAALDAAEAAPGTAETKYDWSVLSLLDQLVREKSGGMVSGFLADATPEAEALAAETIGTEADQVIRSIRAARNAPRPAKTGWLRRLFQPGGRRDALYRKILGPEYSVLETGRFRFSGELHKWMYDRHSLARLLAETGFTETRVCGANESAIPGWSGYGIEVDPTGRVHKPDSLFMEARKPLP